MTEAVLFAHETPLRIGAAALRARDMGRMSAFYRDLLGLVAVSETPERIELGARPEGPAFLILEAAPEAPPAAPDSAGLYHIAFLMPTRRDLGRWLARMAHRRTPVSGVADHDVSEAIYLDDPEGNGIEVYADRPPALWGWDGASVRMGTRALDVAAIMALADSPYEKAPEALRIGHMHLKVGDTVAAGRFYGAAGLDVMLDMSRRGALFMASGGYHHHLGLNVWESRGAGPRAPEAAGLAWFSMEARDAAALARAREGLAAAGAALRPLNHGFEASDPWGTRVRFNMA